MQREGILKKITVTKFHYTLLDRSVSIRHFQTDWLGDSLQFAVQTPNDRVRRYPTLSEIKIPNVSNGQNCPWLRHCMQETRTTIVGRVYVRRDVCRGKGYAFRLAPFASVSL